jgi:hypothetical protein
MNARPQKTSSRKSLVGPLCLFLAAFSAHTVSAQDSSWQRVSITPDVAIMMPGQTTAIDTTKLEVINSSLGGYSFQLKYLKDKYTVKNGDELIQAYDGFLVGYFKTPGINVYTSVVSDTSLNGTMGEWIRLNYSKDTAYQDIYSYLILVNSHFYMISLVTDHPIHSSDPVLRRFFGSMHFPTKPIKEFSGNFPLEARSYRNGQHIGRWFLSALPYIIGIVMVALALFFVVRRVRKPE